MLSKISKSLSLNWSEDVFVIKKVKNTVPWTGILKEKKILERKRIAKANQKDFRVGKVVKGKGNKLYVKWKEDDSSFND